MNHRAGPGQGTNFPDNGPDDPLTLVYFFVPLPEYIALPDAWTVTFHGEVIRTNASLLFHQLKSDLSFESADLSFEAAARAFKWQDAEPSPRARNVPRPGLGEKPATVVEAMIPVQDLTQDSMASAFEQAVGFIEEVQRAYYGAVSMQFMC